MRTAPIRLLAYSLFAICLLAVTPYTFAQKTKPSPSPTPLAQDDQSIKIPVRRVRLPITVVDKKGQFVPGLTKDDFFIFEDKVQQQIETFSDDSSQISP